LPRRRRPTLTVPQRAAGIENSGPDAHKRQCPGVLLSSRAAILNRVGGRVGVRSGRPALRHSNVSRFSTHAPPVLAAGAPMSPTTTSQRLCRSPRVKLARQFACPCRQDRPPGLWPAAIPCGRCASLAASQVATSPSPGAPTSPVGLLEAMRHCQAAGKAIDGRIARQFPLC
jgi:hypothetical protein